MGPVALPARMPAPTGAVGQAARPGIEAGRRLRRSLNGKLGTAVAVAVAAALMVDVGLGLWRETQRWAREKEDALFGTAQVLAASVGKAVQARDTASVQNALRSVGHIPGQLYVSVEDSDHAELASMGDAVRLGNDLTLKRAGTISALDLIRTRTVQVEVPVIDSGAEVGTIRLVSDTQDLFTRFGQVLSAALWSGLAALVIGLLVSIRLQRSITRPLVRLTDVMAGVARNHDYRSNVSVASDDEIGILADSFNDMLTEIRTREREVVTRLVRAAEYRDTDTGDHISRVAGYVEMTARGLGLPQSECELIGLASTMHDMGKIGVPDSILLKKGPLSGSERTEMEGHAAIGRAILDGSTSDLIRLASDIAYSHHERWDGKGYPRGLAGEQIPLPGRIVAVADVFDALTSERPYKKAWPVDKACAHLQDQAGTHFDPACVAAFLKNFPSAQEIVTDARGHHPSLAA